MEPITISLIRTDRALVHSYCSYLVPAPGDEILVIVADPPTRYRVLARTWKAHDLLRAVDLIVEKTGVNS